MIKNNQKISSFFTRISKNTPTLSKDDQNINNVETDIDLIPVTPNVIDGKQKPLVLDTITNKDACSKRKLLSPDTGQLSNGHTTKSPPKKKFNGDQENLNTEILNNCFIEYENSSNEDSVNSPTYNKFNEDNENTNATNSHFSTAIDYKNINSLDANKTFSTKNDSTWKTFGQNSTTSKESRDKSPSTPKKTRKIKSPQKQHSKSPKLNEFNVEVIRNFVKITPSKSSVKSSPIPIVTVRTNSQKKQISILKYVSPSTSK